MLVRVANVCELVQALIDVAAVFGEAWAAEKALPAMLRQLEDSFYLYRITCLQVRRNHVFTELLSLTALAPVDKQSSKKLLGRGNELVAALGICFSTVMY